MVFPYSTDNGLVVAVKLQADQENFFFLISGGALQGGEEMQESLEYLDDSNSSCLFC